MNDFQGGEARGGPQKQGGKGKRKRRAEDAELQEEEANVSLTPPRSAEAQAKGGRRHEDNSAQDIDGSNGAAASTGAAETSPAKIGPPPASNTATANGSGGVDLGLADRQQPGQRHRAGASPARGARQREEDAGLPATVEVRREVMEPGHQDQQSLADLPGVHRDTDMMLPASERLAGARSKAPQAPPVQTSSPATIATSAAATINSSVGVLLASDAMLGRFPRQSVAHQLLAADDRLEMAGEDAHLTGTTGTVASGGAMGTTSGAGGGGFERAGSQRKIGRGAKGGEALAGGRRTSAMTLESVLNHAPRTAPVAAEAMPQSSLPAENDTHVVLLGSRVRSSTVGAAPALEPLAASSGDDIVIGEPLSLLRMPGVGQQPDAIAHPPRPTMQRQQQQQQQQQQLWREEPRPQPAAAVTAPIGFGEVSSSFPLPITPGSSSGSGGSVSDGAGVSSALPQARNQTAEEMWCRTGVGVVFPATTAAASGVAGAGAVASATVRDHDGRRSLGIPGEDSGVRAMGSAPPSQALLQERAEVGARGEEHSSRVREFPMRAAAHSTPGGFAASLSPRLREKQRVRVTVLRHSCIHRETAPQSTRASVAPKYHNIRIPPCFPRLNGVPPSRRPTGAFFPSGVLL